MALHDDIGPAVSRRAFIKGLGTTAVSSAMATATAGAQELARGLEVANAERIVGPGAVSLSLTINGQTVRVDAEPRTTLLDALRYHVGHTGAKEGCGRGGCGACTVLFDGKPVNACMMLAIEAEGHAVTTVEGLADAAGRTPLQEAFIQKDGLMCGYCTSGFLMSLTALLRDHPQPSDAQIRKACSGNLCRCGTYPRIANAVRRSAGMSTSSSLHVIPGSHGHELA